MFTDSEDEEEVTEPRKSATSDVRPKLTSLEDLDPPRPTCKVPLSTPLVEEEDMSNCPSTTQGGKDVPDVRVSETEAL